VGGVLGYHHRTPSKSLRRSLEAQHHDPTVPLALHGQELEEAIIRQVGAGVGREDMIDI
jgi:hypothetical protein